jgi:hypothetical protein
LTTEKIISEKHMVISYVSISLINLQIVWLHKTVILGPQPLPGYSEGKGEDLNEIS